MSEVPKGVWLIAGTSADEPYPCRCHERKYRKCHPVFCPCAGRTDLHNLPPECCAHEYTPEVVVREAREYRIRQIAKGNG